MPPCMQRSWGWTLIGTLVIAGGWAVGCNGNIGDGGGPGATSTVPPAGELGVGPMGIRRLSVFEYDNTINDLLGDDTRPGAQLLPEDARTPFDNDFESQQPSRVLVESAETLANDIATRLLADASRRAAAIGCTSDDVACLTEFVERMGRRVLRRKLDVDEVAAFVELGETFMNDPDADGFESGIEVVLRALLQSAEFLYRVERGTPVDGQPGMFALSGYEIGARMSYLIWASTPDDALLDRAEAGELDTPEGRRQVALEMLDDPRAVRQLDRFHAMWLGYEQMPVPADLTSRMREETSALIERIVLTDKRSWLEIFTESEAYVDDTLAAHYGIPAPGSSTPQWVSLEGTDRSGILSTGAFLSAASNPADTSPTKRGILVRNRLLCEGIPKPDPEAPADQPPDDTLGNCKWDQYEANRNKGPGCKSCHENYDFIGFGLENYDMQGRYRDHDDGKPECTIDGDGDLRGYGTFSGPAELGQLLATDADIDSCVVRYLYQFATGRDVRAADQAFVDALDERFTQDHRFDELIVSIVGGEAFQYRLEMTETN